MKITIFGSGCRKCKATESVIKEVIGELGIDVEIVKIENLQEIMNQGVALTPAIAINGKVKISGHVPSKDEVKHMLEEM